VSVGAYAVASDTGRRRRRNEDAYVVAPPLFAVADGMGGAQAGEVASRLAAATLESGDGRELNGVERVAALIHEANRRVYARASTDPSASGMGTTMTVALVEGMTVTIGHVGDSRAYLVRDGRMEQLTDDHSLVSELLKSGKLSPEEAQVHPQRSVITRAVGTDPDVDVDAFPVDAHEDDVFLLCSDGLTDMVGDEDILDLLHRHRDDLNRAVKMLVAAANRRGGEDNITVVAFRVSVDVAAEDTVEMAAVVDPREAPETDVETEPAEDTMVIPPDRIEAELLEVGSPSALAAARERSDGVSRVRLAATIFALIAIAVALLIWGLLR
jgi:serine/threonine protein phosphatase PrpC